MLRNESASKRKKALPSIEEDYNEISETSQLTHKNLLDAISLLRPDVFQGIFEEDDLNYFIDSHFDNCIVCNNEQEGEVNENIVDAIIKFLSRDQDRVSILICDNATINHNGLYEEAYNFSGHWTVVHIRKEGDALKCYFYNSLPEIDASLKSFKKALNHVKECKNNGEFKISEELRCSGIFQEGKAIEYLGNIQEIGEVVEKQCARQVNGYDCALYALFNATKTLCFGLDGFSFFDKDDNEIDAKNVSLENYDIDKFQNHACDSKFDQVYFLNLREVLYAMMLASQVNAAQADFNFAMATDNEVAATTRKNNKSGAKKRKNASSSAKVNKSKKAEIDPDSTEGIISAKVRGLLEVLMDQFEKRIESRNDEGMVSRYYEEVIEKSSLSQSKELQKETLKSLQELEDLRERLQNIHSDYKQKVLEGVDFKYSNSFKERFLKQHDKYIQGKKEVVIKFINKSLNEILKEYYLAKIICELKGKDSILDQEVLNLLKTFKYDLEQGLDIKDIDISQIDGFDYNENLSITAALIAIYKLCGFSPRNFSSMSTISAFKKIKEYYEKEPSFFNLAMLPSEIKSSIAGAYASKGFPDAKKITDFINALKNAFGIEDVSSEKFTTLFRSVTGACSGKGFPDISRINKAFNKFRYLKNTTNKSSATRMIYFYFLKKSDELLKTGEFSDKKIQHYDSLAEKFFNAIKNKDPKSLDLKAIAEQIIDDKKVQEKEQQDLVEEDAVQMQAIVNEQIEDDNNNQIINDYQSFSEEEANPQLINEFQSFSEEEANSQLINEFQSFLEEEASLQQFIDAIDDSIFLLFEDDNEKEVEDEELLYGEFENESELNQAADSFYELMNPVTSSEPLTAQNLVAEKQAGIGNSYYI